MRRARQQDMQVVLVRVLTCPIARRHSPACMLIVSRCCHCLFSWCSTASQRASLSSTRGYAVSCSSSDVHRSLSRDSVTSLLERLQGDRQVLHERDGRRKKLKLVGMEAVRATGRTRFSTACHRYIDMLSGCDQRHGQASPMALDLSTYTT